MNGDDQEYGASAEALEQIGRFLYGRTQPEEFVPLASIYEAIPRLDAADIDRMLQRLDEKGVLLADFRRDRVKLLGPGKNLYERRCIPELVLGLAYCDWRFSRAVVRISIRTREGRDGAGTGFFVAEPADCIVTNRHVVHQNTITRVDDLDGNEIVRLGADVVEVATDEDLDLALIHCSRPTGLPVLRIDWDENGARPLDEVLILGYPYVALHHPALLHSRGEINFRPRQLRNPERGIRESLMISRVTAPGCSGGPVISSKGFVVGIVTSEQTVEREEAGQETFVRAIPSHYLLELPTLVEPR